MYLLCKTYLALCPLCSAVFEILIALTTSHFLQPPERGNGLELCHGSLDWILGRNSWLRTLWDIGRSCPGKHLSPGPSLQVFDSHTDVEFGVTAWHCWVKAGTVLGGLFLPQQFCEPNLLCLAGLAINSAWWFECLQFHCEITPCPSSGKLLQSRHGASPKHHTPKCLSHTELPWMKDILKDGMRLLGK